MHLSLEKTIGNYTSPLVVYNQSPKIEMTEDMISVLVNKTKQSDCQSIVFVHQHG